MKLLIGSLILAFFLTSEEKESVRVNFVLDQWHQAAAEADFDHYFKLMDESSVFIGTASGERWTKKEFMRFAKPYFDRGQAWDFKPKNRNIVFSDNKQIAWFDEELDTWMLGCRGTGVLKKVGGEWRIMLYDLHVLIENEKMDDFLELRKKQ